MYAPNVKVVSRQRVINELYGENVQEESIDIINTGEQVTDVLNEESHETKTEQQNDKIRLGMGLIKVGANLFNKKKLRGVDAIVFSSMEDMGDYLKVNITVVENDKDMNQVGASKGKMLKTPEINNVLKASVVNSPTQVDQVSGNQNNSGGTFGFSEKGGGDSNNSRSTGGNPIFKFQNLQIEVLGCSQNGRDIECKLNIVAVDNDAYLAAYKSQTKIVDANGSYEFLVAEIKLADAVLDYGAAHKNLVADIPIKGVLRFKNVTRRIASIARLQIYGRLNRTEFTAKLNNIQVSR